jgi:hypothetical protein
VRLYQCKCGRRKQLSGYPPAPCARCSQCESGLAEHHDEFTAHLPHDFSGVRLRDGKSTLVCCYCRNSREDLGLP